MALDIVQYTALMLELESKKGISLWSEYTTKSLSASRGYVISKLMPY